ncbi:MAG TPA: hypothetical protein VFB15_02735 [Candidatus Binataceae bacterium]|jgi:DNA-binding beta-propeller fold protein YncE|nr:hypothetical protein [Candidatus Binataceae bacterium]
MGKFGAPRRTLHGLTVLLLIIAAGCNSDQGSAANAQRLLVAMDDPPTVAIYRAAAETGTLPLATISETAPDSPAGIGIDAAGEVFIANRNGNVRVFAADPQGNYELVRSYAGPHTRIEQPTAIAVNFAGSFYVADRGNGHGRVEWFSGGATNDIYPDKVLEGAHTRITTPSGIALDGSGRAFVANQASNEVLVFDPMAEGDVAPLTVLGGLRAPGHLVVDDMLNVYVINTADDSVAIFESVGPQSWRLKRVLAPPSLRQAAGVAIDDAGEIAIGALGGVRFFSADADPRRTLGIANDHLADVVTH